MTGSRRDRSVVLAGIRAGGIIPVIRAESADTAVRITEALVEGGIRTIEITMTVPDALSAIRSVSARFGPEILLGAGTVTDRSMAEGALEAGAEFLVTPCVVADVIAAARAHAVPILPGALTPTEVFSAWQQGGDIIKIFPASHVGGAGYLKTLKGPFPQIDVCPTGGVNLNTIDEFFAAGAAAVGVGGELVLKSAVQQQRFHEITRLAGQYVEAVARSRARC